MKDSKTVVASVRFAPAEFSRAKAKAALLGIPVGRLVHMATMRLLGDRTDLDRVQGLATALEGAKPLG